MEFANLLEQNPWWRSPQSIENEQKIEQFNKAKIKWIPRMKAFFNLNEDCIYTLRGPRQVGKTTLVKLIIKDKINEGIDPKSIFYFTCDAINNERELTEAIIQFLNFARNSKTERRYIIIDEISSIQHWEKSIKYLADNNNLKNATLILTGSHSLDIKYSIERLPGRRGEGKTEETLNKMLVPMKFSEYVETIKPQLKQEMSDFFYLKKEERFKILFNLFNGTIDPIIENMKIYQKDLKELFDDYLLTGGVILPINKYYEKGAIDNSIYELYVRALIGDLARWKYNEKIVKQILRSVISKMTTKVSLNTIASENEIGSHNTVSNYLNAIENSFVLLTFYQMDFNQKTAKYKKERKVYFDDPFIYHAIRGWVFGYSDYFEQSRVHLSSDVEKSKIIEMVVASHLVSFVYNLVPSDIFSTHENVFFWKKKGSDKEVDFIIKHENNIYPIEVKYQNKVGKNDLKNLFSLKKGIILSKQNSEIYSQYSIIPIEFFLMLI